MKHLLVLVRARLREGEGGDSGRGDRRRRAADAAERYEAREEAEGREAASEASCALDTHARANYNKKLKYVDKGHTNQYQAFAKDIITDDSKITPTLNDYYLSIFMAISIF